MPKRLKVVFFPPPPVQKEPWERDLVDAVDGRHQLVFGDPLAPAAPQLDGADVVIDFGGHNATREMADVSRSVKLWQIMSVGYENFDVAYWREKGIPLANCPGHTSANGLAECALMLMLMLAHRWKETQANMAGGLLYLPMGTELQGKTLGVLGFGASGRALAKRAQAFDLNVSAIDIVPISDEEQTRFGLRFGGTPDDLDTLLPECDYVSLHLPLTAETRGIMDARRLKLMKPSARLINVARGALVDQKALYEALVKGELGGAGLDVFDTEPVSPETLLLKLDNVVALPHVAGSTDSTSRRRAAFTAENVDLVAQGLEPQSRVDR